LAVKPQDSDTFLREVDDELRRERVTSFFTRYGSWIIGGVLLLLAAIGGWIYWQHSQATAAGEASEKLIQVVEQLDGHNARAAAGTIDELAGSDRPGYRIAGLFARANAQIQTNAIPAAIDTLKSIAGDDSAPQPYRDVALIRQTQLEFDRLNPNEVIQRLQPFAQTGNPWHGSAGEMMGVALMKAGHPDQAARVFEALARDLSVPDSIRARATQLASTLGVDTFELDPTILRQAEQAAAAPPQPAPAAAAAPGAAPGNAAGARANAPAPAGNAAAPVRAAQPAQTKQ
jgi:hypothetical protein